MSEPPARYVERTNDPQLLIRNCQFAFRCHAKWQELEKTADPRVRYCHDCSREVVLCQRDAQLRAGLQANQCIAIPQPSTSGITHTVGVVLLQSEEE